MQFIGRNLCDTLIGQHQHGVARQDGLVGIPTAMYRLMAATQVGIVHQVVVQQGVVVVGFNTTGWHENVLGVFAPEVIAKQHQHRADALATKREYILDRIIERCRLSVVRQAVEIIVDQLQDFVG